ncbi:unnamed protein product, partial [Mesorhabditis belari]|uniref:Uncharacterized protein n=1 Tax=Mesorhabditis belari TaxID=2138241 RepID=A0AAF3JBC0_9BILA
MLLVCIHSRDHRHDAGIYLRNRDDQHHQQIGCFPQELPEHYYDFYRGISGGGGTLYIDLPLLISSFYRMYIYCAALCTLNTGLMERLFAVFFVRDYEYIERLWIQWYLQIWGTSVCIACSVGYTFFGTLESGLFFKIMLIVLLSLIVIACLIFIFISYLNANFLKLLLTTFDIKKYTLSRRFQLEENVKALLLIKQMFLSHGVYCFFAMGLFATPYVIFELNTPELELSIALFETTMSLYPVYFMPYILYLTPSWREKTAIYLKSILKMKPHIRRRVQRTKSTSNEQETKIYFDQLRDLWA